MALPSRALPLAAFAAALAVASPALAQPSPYALHPPWPPAAPPAAPPATGGWAVFGVETGLFVGGGVGVAGALLLADAAAPAPGSGDTHGGAPLLALGAMTLVVGGAALGGYGFERAARSGAWSREAGWGAAATWPGALTGLALAGGIVTAIDRDASAGARLAAGGFGAVAGGALGYAVFRELAAARGRTGWAIVSVWAGFLTGEIVGLVVTQSAMGGSRDNGAGVLLGAATGGVLGALVGWLVTPPRRD